MAGQLQVRISGHKLTHCRVGHQAGGVCSCGWASTGLADRERVAVVYRAHLWAAKSALATTTPAPKRAY